MEQRQYARSRSVTRSGNSHVVSLPKAEADRLPEDAEATVVRDEEAGVLRLEIPLEDE